MNKEKFLCRLLLAIVLGLLWVSAVAASEPAIIINDCGATGWVLEPTRGNKVYVSFTIRLINADSRSVVVNYQSADGTATAPWDYTSIRNNTMIPLVLSASQPTKAVGTFVYGDGLVEGNEYFDVLLYNVSYSDGSGTPLILDGSGRCNIDDRNS